MLNEESTQDSELHLEVTPDSESLESSQTTLDGEGEIEDARLNLDSENEQKADKQTLADENAKRQVDHWQQEVNAGRKDLKDAPAWVQKRIAALKEGSEAQNDTEQVVRRVLEKEREDAEFKDLQGQIPALTAAQAKELQERYKVLRPAGKVAALKACLDAMGLSQKLKEAEQRGIAKGKMSLPKSGQPSVKRSESTVAGVPVSTIQNNAAWENFVKSGRS